jgi:beta-glucosidase-like glycosyl hydrolase
MQGLKSFYSSPEEMYLAVFLAGNDLILDFSEDPNEIYHLIRVVKRAVEKSKISETMIDASVKKILEAKGFKVVE